MEKQAAKQRYQPDKTFYEVRRVQTSLRARRDSQFYRLMAEALDRRRRALQQT